MIKKLSILMMIVFGLSSVYAQKAKNNANVVGHVECNGQHVPYVTISIDGTTLATMTDATGHFKMVHLPVGTHTLRASAVGYTSVTKEITLVNNKTKEVNFEVQEDVMRMDEVVVSADRNQTNRRESPVVITSLSPKILEITQSVNLAEGLAFTPGLRTETNCQNCGFTQLRMNGMEGPYTQILMNSRPVFSGLAGVYALEMIPTNMIERLEVVRGGGSSLFGGNAIAGTVNIITKETRRNTFEIENRVGVIGVGAKDGGNPAIDEQLSVNASIVSDDEKTGGYVYAMLRDRDAFDNNDDGYTELVEMKNTTFGVNAFHKFNAKSKLSFDGYRISEYRRGGNKLDYLPHETDIAEQLDHLISGGNLAYELYTNSNHDKLTAYGALQHVSRGSYYGAEKDPNAYGDTKNLSSSVGAQYVINSKNFLFPTSTTLFGIDNSNDRLEDTKLGANGDANTSIVDQSVNTLGSFIQQDWKSDKFNLSLGARYDYYMVKDMQKNGGEDNSNGVFVPRASLLYKITPDMRIRVGYAKGYRAPQVFNEDMHIELTNAKRVTTVNSPDLKQETSNSISASLNMDFELGHSPNNVLIEGFYTQLKNPFASEFSESDTSGNYIYTRVNSKDGAKVMGVNIEFKSYITKTLEAQLGFTLQQSSYDTAQQWGEEDTSFETKFLRTPDQYGYATLIWKPTHHLNTNFSLNYTGSMLVPHFGLSQSDYDDAIANGVMNEGDVIVGEELVKSKSFLTADFQIAYDIDINKNHETELQLFAGVKNIFNQYQDDFDKGVFRDAGYVYGPRQPRTINIGIKLSKF